MARKITNDEIKYILSLDANGVQKSLSELQTANAGLKRSNAELREEMTALEAAGKKESEEWNRLNTALKGNSDQIALNNQKMKSLSDTLGVNDMTMRQLRKSASDLKRELDNTSQSADPAKYAELQGKLSAVKGRMDDLYKGSQSLTDILTGIPGPIGAVSQSVVGLGKNLMVLATNPVVAVLVALGLVVMGLVKSFKEFASSTEEASARTQKALGPLKVIGVAIGDLFEWMGEKIVWTIEKIGNGFRGLISFISDRFGIFDDLNEKLTRQNQIEIENYEIQQRRKALVKEQAQIENEMLQLRLKAQQKDKYTETERLQFIEKYLQAEDMLFQKKEQMAQAELDLAREKAKQDDNSYEDNMRLAELEAAVTRAQIESTQNQMAVERRRQSLLSEIAGEVKKSAKSEKDQLTDKLSTVDAMLQSEQLIQKQHYAAGRISHDEYLQELERLELASLQRKLQIYGLDAKTRMDLEDAILDHKIKIMESLPRLETRTLDQDKKTATAKERVQGQLDQRMSVLSKKRAAEQKKEFEQQKAHSEMTEGLVLGASEAFGGIIGGFISGNEEAMALSGHNLLLIALDTLRQIVLLSVAEVFAKEVGSKGLLGVPLAAAAAAVINGAFAAVKSAISKPSKSGSGSSGSSSGSQESIGYATQRASGKYDVVGADDKRTYRSVPYLNTATGIIPNPTLISEYGPELIVSAPHLRLLQRDVRYPVIMDALRDVTGNQVRQRAEGKYDSVDFAKPTSGSDPLLRQVYLLLRDLHRNGVQASINYSHFEAARDRVDRLRSRVSKRP